MSRFFHQKSHLAGFEELVSEKQREEYLEVDYKKYEAGKIYTFLENNYYRLQKMIDLLHRKIYLLQMSLSAEDQQISLIQRKKKVHQDLMEELMVPGHPLQKKLAALFNQFNHE